MKVVLIHRVLRFSAENDDDRQVLGRLSRRRHLGKKNGGSVVLEYPSKPFLRASTDVLMMTVGIKKT